MSVFFFCLDLIPAAWCVSFELIIPAVRVLIPSPVFCVMALARMLTSVGSGSSPSSWGEADVSQYDIPHL